MAIRDITKRLAKGGEIGESISGGIKAGLKQYSPGNVLKKAFSGDDLLSSLIRGRFAKTKQTKSPTDEKVNESSALLTIIAKNSMSLPGMARDMNVLRQNIVKLVKLQGGQTTTFGGKADEFFMREDAREQSLEDARADYGPTPVADDGEQKSGGILKSISAVIVSLLTILGVAGAKTGSFLKFIFEKVSEKFIELVEIAKEKIKIGIDKLIATGFKVKEFVETLYNQIKQAWEEYKSNGTFQEKLLAAFNGLLNFLTFGKFSSVDEIIDKLESFFDPFLQVFKKIWDGLTAFFKGIGKIFGVDTAAFETPMPDLKPEISYTPGGEQSGQETSSVVSGSQSGARGINLVSGTPSQISGKELSKTESSKPSPDVTSDNVMNNYLGLKSGDSYGAYGDVNMSMGGDNNMIKVSGGGSSSGGGTTTLDSPSESEESSLTGLGNISGAGGTPSLGSNLNNISSDVAMSQMLEPFEKSEDAMYVDNSVKNRNSNTSSQEEPIADVYDEDLLELLVGT